MGIEADIDTPLAEACRKAGSQSALGRIAGKSQPTVHERLTKRGPVWPESVFAIEKATGISRHRLRPDLYPREAPAPPPPATGAGDLEPAR